MGWSPKSLAELPGAPGTKELLGEPEGRGVATRWPHVPFQPPSRPRLHAPFTLVLPGAARPLFVLLPLPAPLFS